jgi:hypothetical protein
MEHCCRSGKTWSALRAIYGNAWTGGPATKLRPHQAEALRCLDGLEAGTAPRRRCAYVFSTLVVLKQFVEDYLVAAVEKNWLSAETLGRVRVVASADDETWSHHGSWLRRVPGNAEDAEESELQRLLRDNSTPLLLLTTYNSAHRVDTALEAADEALELVVFDEGHNVHTKKRGFLYGAQKEAAAQPDAEEPDAASQPSSPDGELEAADAPGLTRLERFYPRRLYLTATPRAPMRQEEHAQVYGSADDPKQWHRFLYSDLVEAQLGPTYETKCVKEFDVSVLLSAAKPPKPLATREMQDRVDILRKVMSRGRGGDNAVRRVMAFHAFAMHGDRAAVDFARREEWKKALQYLRRAEPGLCAGQLATWVNSQRTKKDSLAAARRQRLDDIGFRWAPRSAGGPNESPEQPYGGTFTCTKRVHDSGQKQSRRASSSSTESTQASDQIRSTFKRKRLSCKTTPLKEDTPPRRPRGADETADTPAPWAAQKRSGSAIEGTRSSKRRRVEAAASSSLTPHSDENTSRKTKRKLSESTPLLTDESHQTKRRKVEAALGTLLEEGSVQIDAKGRPDAEGVTALASKGYDAAAFTKLHHDWKDANLGELLSLSTPSSDSVLFLDHWVTSAKDKRLRTTDALLAAGFAAKRCYCANPDAAIVGQLKRRRVRAVKGTFAGALHAIWREHTFEVVYADFCYASAEHVKADLATLFDDEGMRRRPRVLVWTLTGRAEGSLHGRLAAVHEFTCNRGYKPALGTMAASWRTFRPSSVVTGFYIHSEVTTA